MHDRLDPWALAGFVLTLFSFVATFHALAAYGERAIRYVAWVALVIKEALA